MVRLAEGSHPAQPLVSSPFVPCRRARGAFVHLDELRLARFGPQAEQPTAAVQRHLGVARRAHFTKDGSRQDVQRFEGGEKGEGEVVLIKAFADRPVVEVGRAHREQHFSGRRVRALVARLMNRPRVNSRLQRRALGARSPALVSAGRFFPVWFEELVLSGPLVPRPTRRCRFCRQVEVGVPTLSA